MSRLLVDVEPRQWLIDTKMKVRYRVFDPISSELIPGALIVGYGGNLKIMGQTDQQGEYTADIEHKMPGFTSHIILLPERGKSFRDTRPERQLADAQCSNGTTTVREMSDIPREVPFGTKLNLELVFKNDWTDLIMHNRIPIPKLTEKHMNFQVPEDCTELHIRLNWTGLVNSFGMFWKTPDQKRETAIQPRLLHRSEYGDLTITPLCLQPEDDGLIRNPQPGKWQLFLDSSNVRSDNSLITAEVFAKHKDPHPLAGIKIRIAGCGLNAEYITDNKGSVHISELPKHKGIVQITFWKDNLIYQNCHLIHIK